MMVYYVRIYVCVCVCLCLCACKVYAFKRKWRQNSVKFRWVGVLKYNFCGSQLLLLYMQMFTRYVNMTGFGI